MGQQGPEPDGGFAWWAVLLALPEALLCCGGPVLLAAAGAGLAAAAAWVRGFAGLALLAAAPGPGALGQRGTADLGRALNMAAVPLCRAYARCLPKEHYVA